MDSKIELFRGDNPPSNTNLLWLDTSNVNDLSIKAFDGHKWVKLNVSISGDLSKAEIQEIAKNAVSSMNYVTGDYVRSEIENIDIPDTSNLATKNELNKVENKIITNYEDLTNKPYIPTIRDFATTEWVEDRPISTFNNNVGYITEEPLNNYVKKKNGYGLISENDIEKIHSNKQSIEILNGNIYKEGSVAYIVNEKFKEYNSLSKIVVTELPPIQEANPNMLYLVKNDNTYEQYLVVDGEYISLGTTDINLNNYVKTEKVSSSIEFTGEYDENGNWIPSLKDKDNIPTNNAVVSYIKDKTDNLVSKSQITNSVTPNSGEIVTSGAVYDAINSLEDLNHVPRVIDMENYTPDITDGGEVIVQYVGKTNDKYVTACFYKRNEDFTWEIINSVDLSQYVHIEDNKSLVLDTDIAQITTNKNDITALYGEENKTLTPSIASIVKKYIGESGHLSKKVVNTLPETGEDNTLYLVKTDKDGIYKQYLFVDNKFVELDNTEIDLSGYWNENNLIISDIVDNTTDTAKTIPTKKAVYDKISEIENKIPKEKEYVGKDPISINNDNVEINYDKKYFCVNDNKELSLLNQSYVPRVSDLSNYNCEVGTIVQYIGETNENYVNGYFYKFNKSEGGAPEVITGGYWILDFSNSPTDDIGAFNRCFPEPTLLRKRYNQSTDNKTLYVDSSYNRYIYGDPVIGGRLFINTDQNITSEEIISVEEITAGQKYKVNNSLTFNKLSSGFAIYPTPLNINIYGYYSDIFFYYDSNNVIHSFKKVVNASDWVYYADNLNIGGSSSSWKQINVQPADDISPLENRVNKAEEDIEELKNRSTAEWGNITGDITEQEDLNNALNTKLDGTSGEGVNSSQLGLGTIAKGAYQVVLGRYNVIDNENRYALIVGNGTSETDRSNAYTVDWNGNIQFNDISYIKNLGNVSGVQQIEDASLATENNVLYIVTG